MVSWISNRLVSGRYRVRSPASVFCFKAQKGPMVRGGAAECRKKTVREPLWGVFFFLGGGSFFFSASWRSSASCGLFSGRHLAGFFFWSSASWRSSAWPAADSVSPKAMSNF